MRKSRTQIILIAVAVQFIGLLLAGGISTLVSTSQVGREITEGVAQQRLTALDLAKRTQLSPEEIISSLSLSTYPMRIVDEGEVTFTSQQQKKLERGGNVDIWSRGHGGSYFLLRETLVVIETRTYNAKLLVSALRSVTANLILTFIVLSAFSLGSKRMVQSLVDLTEATKEIASGNFGFRLPAKRKRGPFRPTAEYVALTENFNRMAQELQSIEYLRRDFTSNVSHEIKTPIAAISGYAQLLAGGQLPDAERKEYAAAISTESRKLAVLSDNLLKLTRLESQQIRPPAKRFALDEQLRRAVAALYPEIERKKIAVSSDLPETAIVSDEELLEQVWRNLLDNAVKFTPEGGGVHVAILPSARGVAVRVADTGIGMDAAAAERIYEKFYQADASRQSGGSGLGLPLVKRIVDILGGSIQVKSAPGEGTAFTVSLPQG